MSCVTRALLSCDDPNQLIVFCHSQRFAKKVEIWETLEQKIVKLSDKRLEQCFSTFFFYSRHPYFGIKQFGSPLPGSNNLLVKSSSEIGGNPRAFHGTQGFRGTPVENHWLRPMNEKNESKIQVLKKDKHRNLTSFNYISLDRVAKSRRNIKRLHLAICICFGVYGLPSCQMFHTPKGFVEW